MARRLDRELDLDLATIWPYLWLTAPDTTRTEITAAREALGRAATDTYAVLMEAAVRLRTPALARDLGLDHTGPLTRETGRAPTSLLTETPQRQP